MNLYAATIFLGAFLLFQVQPLIGKFILPWFGGGPGVWTTCLLFFQLALLGGYAYAHFLGSGFPARRQALVHGIVLAVSLATLPIIPAEAWKPAGGADPTGRILLLLLASVGLPYFVLSTTGPLLQRWFSLSHPGTSPYRLYALSNLGSLLALVSYPFLFEPALTRKGQAWAWSGGMIVFAALCGLCAWRLRTVPAETPAAGKPNNTDTEPATPPSWTQRFYWIALPAMASVMLLATTNKMCTDVAVVPFLWVLPLSLYLLSFIISFDSPRWYSRRWFGAALIVAMAGVCVAVYQVHDISIVWQVAIYSFAVFVICMCAHGEVYRLKPHPRFLTMFYLMISTGGALGGLLVALVAPFVFTHYYEFQIGLVLSGLIYVAAICQNAGKLPASASDVGQAAPAGRFAGHLPLWFLLTAGGLAVALSGVALFGMDGAKIASLRQPVMNALAHVLGDDTSRDQLLRLFLTVGGVLYLAVLILSRWLPVTRRLAVSGALCVLGAVILSGIALAREAREDRSRAIGTGRNFYGVLTVIENAGAGSEIDSYYVLQHGQITHGMQLRHPEYRRWPTTYYGEKSGVGMAVRNFPRQHAQRIGVVGLGTGSMAVYTKRDDYLRIYEINPMVEDFARTYFTYLSDTAAKVEVAMGDARLSMEREEPQRFDILVLDAFSSDAIPVHLLTLESFELYQRHLQPDGVIAVHISNRHLDLEPVVLAAAGRLGYQTAIIENYDGDSSDTGDEESEPWWIYTSIWVLVTNNEALLADPQIEAAALAPKKREKAIRLWTDDYTALYQVLDGDFFPSWGSVKEKLLFWRD
jgi:hypothetical protein